MRVQANSIANCAVSTNIYFYTAEEIICYHIRALETCRLRQTFLELLQLWQPDQTEIRVVACPSYKVPHLTHAPVYA